jgi:hypothetical protein
MPDGSTYADHLRAAEASGIDTGELEIEEAPPGFSELLHLFWQLRRIAGSNGMAPNAISCAEIYAWQQLTEVSLLPAEVDMIFALDNAAIAAFAEK